MNFTNSCHLFTQLSSNAFHRALGVRQSLLFRNCCFSCSYTPTFFFLYMHKLLENLYRRIEQKLDRM
ncbi:hypothetical protein HanRHA438_Chr15g0703881 [Helianthus annuus]|nr:hypothetical protein HanIR_Chr15g0751441 [Helianthus annuus]KAJ0844565.1 hypothetical protein HanRHA438_Chr15g0703881 [Helianthus annuus]